MPPHSLSNEQSYVLGLLVGGGTIANGTFTIVMPFDKWGADPSNAAAISRDLLTKIRKLFFDAYGIDIDYSIGNKGRWSLTPLGKPNIQSVIQDLATLSLPTSGVLLETANLITAKSSLTGMKAEYFLTGIFDARASLTESHRRFIDSAPVVSIEIPGSTMNFSFVVQLCAWLTDLGSVTDQILFNHPCQHATSDPTYSGWKKGFKIRFLVKSFISIHSFAMRAKASEASSLASRQSTPEQLPCANRPISANTVSIHDDIGCAELPNQVRNKIFLHYHHICAAMGCPHAPLNRVKALVSQAKQHISVFPKLSKGEYKEMKSKHGDLATSYFPSSTLTSGNFTCKNIRDSFSSDDYPDIDKALAYILANKLNGKRHVGPMADILEKNSSEILRVARIDGIDKAPLFIGKTSVDRGVIVSSPSGHANQQALAAKISISGININVR